MEAVRGGEAARRQGAGARRHRMPVELYRAPGGGGAAHRQVCESVRTGECGGGRGLRVLHPCRHGRGGPGCDVREVEGDGGWGGAGVGEVLGEGVRGDRWSSLSFPRKRESSEGDDVAEVVWIPAFAGMTEVDFSG